MTTKGWVSIHRQLCENDLWLSEPFTRGQAWVDMICWQIIRQDMCELEAIKCL